MTDLLIHQAEFIESEALHTGLIGGYGSGKSFAGVLKTCIKLTQNKTNCAYYLPTYSLIKDIAFPKFAETLSMLNIRYSINKSDKDIITPFGEIKLRSMDNPDSIVGYEVGYSLIDEADILATDKMNDIFARVIGRNRAINKNNQLNQTDLVGTPEGFKFAYNFFSQNKPNRVLIKGKTKNNPFLPESFIETLKDTYTAQQLDAYLDGEFVNLTSGTVHSDYDIINNHSDREIQPNDILHIGMDFNITNMSAVIHVIENGLPIAVAEEAGLYDTKSMANRIKEKYANHTIIVYPDASGKNRHSSGETDHNILRSARFQVFSMPTNPFVKDRVNTMNMMFRKGYKVNRFKCPQYSQSLMQLAYNKGGEPDKTSGFDHLCEAGGYFIYYQFSNTRPIVAL
jgi:phage terminase large subunit